MNWQVHQLGEIAETALGKMLDNGKRKGLPQVPYLRNVNVQWGRVDTGDLLMMELADHERERFGVSPGDLLVCEGGEIGRSAIWTGGANYIAYQKALHRIRPGKSLDVRFLRYLLEHYSLNGTLAGLATGSTIAHLPQQQLRRVPVPVPPLDEQCRIVDLIEDHLSHLEAGERWLSVGQRKVEALWLAALSESRRALVGATTRTIGDIAETTLGKMLDAKKQLGRPTPYLRNINVRWREFDLSDVQLTPLTKSEVERFDVRPGDVMACEGGEPGRCAVWDRPVGEVAFQKALHRIRVRNTGEVLPSFLALMLEEAIRLGRCNRMFTGTTIKHLPQEKLRVIEIPVPASDIQRRVVDRLAELAEAQMRLRAAIANGAARSAAMRRSLLTAAFSGRLSSQIHHAVSRGADA
ncbi:restriction endonuclease subunit S [Mycobacterium intracellulare]|uniref:restriction endonuclease subunit S n=1 Tax=Mycobacterium intracellulare TaxID=1767 RepID=UPI0007E9D812|nr:restriction endonuclease subunit S [Mycobacterium intracellulare]OBH36435.1 hypothetical protein A5690_08610 [Mycobacterium intracellulare]